MRSVGGARDLPLLLDVAAGIAGVSSSSDEEPDDEASSAGAWPDQLNPPETARAGTAAFGFVFDEDILETTAGAGAETSSYQSVNQAS